MYSRSFEPLDKASLRIYAGCSATYIIILIYVAASRLWPEVTGMIVRCPLHELTGLECPSCGLTRAVHALLDLDFARAARLNILAFPVAVLAVAFPLVCISDLLCGTRILPLTFKGKQFLKRA